MTWTICIDEIDLMRASKLQPLYSQVGTAIGGRHTHIKAMSPMSEEIWFGSLIQQAEWKRRSQSLTRKLCLSVIGGKRHSRLSF